MKSITTFLLLSACAGLFTSCSSSLSEAKYKTFTKRPDYKKTHEVYRDEELITKANKSNTKVTINLTNQRAQLLVDDKVAMDLPCCTGKAGKRTPAGNFRIKRKLVAKRSNIFGTLYKNGRRVHGGDRRKYHGSYDRYVGAALPYWMRLTSDGIGMHYSKSVYRYPRSNGCIRMPKSAVKTIFAKTRVGTPVQVVY